MAFLSFCTVFFFFISKLFWVFYAHETVSRYYTYITFLTDQNCCCSSCHLFFLLQFRLATIINFLVSEMIAFLSSCVIHWMISFSHLFYHSWPQWHSNSDHCKIIFIFNMISTACWLDVKPFLFYFPFFVRMNDYSFRRKLVFFTSPNGRWPMRD